MEANGDTVEGILIIMDKKNRSRTSNECLYFFGSRAKLSRVDHTQQGRSSWPSSSANGSLPTLVCGHTIGHRCGHWLLLYRIVLLCSSHWVSDFPSIFLSFYLSSFTIYIYFVCYRIIVLSNVWHSSFSNSSTKRHRNNFGSHFLNSFVCSMQTVLFCENVAAAL